MLNKHSIRHIQPQEGIAPVWLVSQNSCCLLCYKPIYLIPPPLGHQNLLELTGCPQLYKMVILGKQGGHKK